MKKKIRLMIAAISLSFIAFTPYWVRTSMAQKTEGKGQAIGYCIPQYEHYFCKNLHRQEQDIAELSGGCNQGILPVLLWHRFSFTPQPVFIRWLIA